MAIDRGPHELCIYSMGLYYTPRGHSPAGQAKTPRWLATSFPEIEYHAFVLKML